MSFPQKQTLTAVCTAALLVCFLGGCSEQSVQDPVLPPSQGTLPSKPASIDTSMPQTETAGVNDVQVNEEISGAPNGFKQVTIHFRDQGGLQLRIVVPECWKLKPAGDSWQNELRSPVEIFVEENRIGFIGYESFTADAAQKGHTVIYEKLTNENHISWKNEYKPIAVTTTASTARCTIAVSQDATSDGKARQWRGILSYDTELLKYIGICISSDFPTDEQLLITSMSIRLYK